MGFQLVSLYLEFRQVSSLSPRMFYKETTSLKKCMLYKFFGIVIVLLTVFFHCLFNELIGYEKDTRRRKKS